MEIGEYTWDGSYTPDRSKYVITRTLVTAENIDRLRDTKRTLLEVYANYLSHYNWNNLAISVIPDSRVHISRMYVIKNPVILV